VCSFPELTPDLVASVAYPDWKLNFLNQAGRRWLGFGGDVPISSRCFIDFIPLSRRGDFLAKMEAVAKGEEVWPIETELLPANGGPIPVSVHGSIRSGDGGGFVLIARDLTFTADLQHRLMETSRLAAMAEVTSGVLHNIGNAFNSVNTAASVIADKLSQSRLGNLSRVSKMLDEHASDLATFLASDARGRQLPTYLRQLSEHLASEQEALLSEADALRKSVEHIKTIIGMQQGFAHASSLAEDLSPVELVEEALLISEASLSRHQITATRDFATAVPTVYVARHKVLQILVNLIRNAKHALDECGHSDRRMELSVRAMENNRVKITVADNGVGICPENLARIFSFGFTTKKTGHGFGLHSSVLAAEEMHGSLRGESDGLGKGARFILELPCQRIAGP
jgi:signal transduction histidine kinase